MKNPWTWIPTLYFAEGLPYVAVMFVATVMYKQLELSNAEITFYTSWLYLPWVIKPLWSPFIDVIKTKRWWIIAMQLLIGAAFGGVAFTIPVDYWLQCTLACFWLMAFSSATHDIAADGFYMLGLREKEQAMFVGIRSTFYRLATIFGQGVLIMLAGNLQWLFRESEKMVSIKYSWSLVFYGMAGLFIALALWHSRALPKPKADKERADTRPAPTSDTLPVGAGLVSAREIFSEVIDTLVSFFNKFPKKEVALAFAFMLFYRMPEGLLVKVTPLFLLDGSNGGGLGLSPQEVGFVQGTVGVIGLTLGGIIGGILVSRDGLKKWLWPMVCAITLPDAVYIYLSSTLTDSLFLVNLCLFIEQFGYGFGFTAYMLYLIYYSQGEHKTSHYALCTALMALSMMLPGLIAGWLQEMVGYQMFFILVFLFCAITFLVTALVKIDPEFGKKEE